MRPPSFALNSFGGDQSRFMRRYLQVKILTRCPDIVTAENSDTGWKNFCSCKNGVGKTVCSLFDAAAFPVWSYTKKFREEFEYFIKHKKSMVRGESLSLAGAHH